MAFLKRVHFLGYSPRSFRPRGQQAGLRPPAGTPATITGGSGGAPPPPNTQEKNAAVMASAGRGITWLATRSPTCWAAAAPASTAARTLPTSP